ncbi:DUF6053 domain-containing protein [Lysobacter enzymogenes]
MGGPSGPTPFAAIIAIGHQSVGPEGLPITAHRTRGSLRC